MPSPARTGGGSRWPPIAPSRATPRYPGRSPPRPSGTGQGWRSCSRRASVPPGARFVPSPALLALEPPSIFTHATPWKSFATNWDVLKNSPYRENRWQQLGSSDYYWLMQDYGWQWEISGAAEINADVTSGRGKKSSRKERGMLPRSQHALNNQESCSDNIMIRKCLSPASSVSLHQNKTFSEV